jgi:hypothetical protein
MGANLLLYVVRNFASFFSSTRIAARQHAAIFFAGYL